MWFKCAFAVVCCEKFFSFVCHDLKSTQRSPRPPRSVVSTVARRAVCVWWVHAMLPIRRRVSRLVATNYIPGAAQVTRTQITAFARRFVTSDTTHDSDSVDVCVVGGGVVGTALACLLRVAPSTRHLRVTLVDRNKAPSPTLLDAPPPIPDPRVSALTPASVALLRQVGAWARIEKARTAPFTAMQVWDARSVGHVRYDSGEMGADCLGHVVENSLIHAALAEAADKLGVRAAKPSAVKALSNDKQQSGAFAEVHLETCDDLSTATTSAIKASVVVGADGANSVVRDLAGIRSSGWPYFQKALVGTVTLDRASDVAWQRFLPNGPLAVLPVTHDPRLANVVWTNTFAESDRLVSLSDEKFAFEVDQAFRGVGKYGYDEHETSDDESDLKKNAVKFLRPATEKMMGFLEQTHRNGGLGAGAGLVGGAPFEQPPGVVSARGKRGAFPLATKIAGRHVSHRLALIGDAAHQVHPLGGQGVNLGLRDVALLHQVFCDTIETGGDIGSARCLSAYEEVRVGAFPNPYTLFDAPTCLIECNSCDVCSSVTTSTTYEYW